MENKKRFPDWKPEIGERALVPGGPACAHYVAELDADDVLAIENGHRGYTPLRVEIVDTRLLGTTYESMAVRMVLTWREGYHHWEGDGIFNTLSAALRAVRRVDGGGDAVVYRVDNESNRFFNNPSARLNEQTDPRGTTRNENLDFTGREPAVVPRLQNGDCLGRGWGDRERTFRTSEHTPERLCAGNETAGVLGKR